MAKKEKIVDLKSKPEKITDEQLDKIQETINTMNRAQIEIGSMELKKHEMLHQLSNIKDGLATLQQELQKEYGTVDINIQDGTINYGDVEADS
jgi:RecB family endonuclease NucS